MNKPGAYALDCRGSILHYNPNVKGWQDQLFAMMKDVELQMLGMVEIRVVTSGWTYHYPARYNDPNYLYQDWNAVLNQKYQGAVK